MQAFLRVAVTALFLLGSMAMGVPAGAHHAPSGWRYPPQCCGGGPSGDCAPLAPGAVKWTVEGWLIVETGEVIGFEKAQKSGDHDWHRCRMKQSDPLSKTRTVWMTKQLCLYVPEPEF